MLPAEFPEDHGLADPGPAMDKKVGHAVALRVGQQVHHGFERLLGGWMADPPFGSDPLDALVIRQGREVVMSRYATSRCSSPWVGGGSFCLFVLTTAP